MNRIFRSFKPSLRQLSFRRLCARIWDAKKDEVLAKGKANLLNLFDDNKYVRSMAVNPSKLQEVLNTFPKTQVVKLEDMQVI